MLTYLQLVMKGECGGKEFASLPVCGGGHGAIVAVTPATTEGDGQSPLKGSGSDVRNVEMFSRIWA